MPHICYRSFRFKPETLECIKVVNSVITEFAAQGFKMTLRQIYYQLVAKDLFPDDRKWSMVGSGKWVRDPAGTKNAEPNYDWLGDVVTDGRMAGMIDWNAVEDRNRELEKRSHWDTPADIVDTCARAYNRDLWADQPCRPEVWIEKAALAGIFEGVCTENDVPYFACRGYSSVSSLWEAGQRFYEHVQNGQKVVIFHFGDHDPSGLDMTRDIEDRLLTFLLHHYAHDQGYDLSSDQERADALGEVSEQFKVRRIALSMEQIDEFNPPPNPVKKTDARWKRYADETGLEESWELDALDPATLVGLAEAAIASVREDAVWQQALAREKTERQQLALAAKHWGKVTTQLSKLKKKE